MADVSVGQTNGQYYLQVKEGAKQAQIPIPECKNEQEANMIKEALVKRINEQATVKPEGVGEKMDKVA